MTVESASGINQDWTVLNETIYSPALERARRSTLKSGRPRISLARYLLEITRSERDGIELGVDTIDRLTHEDDALRRRVAEEMPVNTYSGFRPLRIGDPVWIFDVIRLVEEHRASTKNARTGLIIDMEMKPHAEALLRLEIEKENNSDSRDAQ